MLIDTHAHLLDKSLVGDVDSIISQFQDNDITSVIEVGYDLNNSIKSVELASRYDNIHSAVGIHPSENYLFSDEDIAKLRELAKHPKVVAIGEVGLDYHYDNDTDIQQINFLKMIDLASDCGLPLVLHIRDAYGDMESKYFDILADKIKANILFHCYSGSAELVRQITKKLPNSYFAYGGATTFKNFRKQDVVREVPEDRLLLETDCPYMTPEPHRGKLNSPLYLKHICTKVAEIRGWDYNNTAAKTTANAKRFFNL